VEKGAALFRNFRPPDTVDDRRMADGRIHDRADTAGAAALVATCVRRLFSFVSEQQAHDLAAAVLHELRVEGVCLARDAVERQ
jgi:hypothetical protein